ncbi:MAG: hypothetical protein GWN00_39985, partial [Aliifodinibius sp.]|nr:hypothetical protein [Fodinibius sp.]NIV13328.1 hypothetical protein [Fodinibius sp.]NIY30737.1 hypothetical protein [Fodinibius sp.]
MNIKLSVPRWVRFSVVSLISIIVFFGVYYFIYVTEHSNQLDEHYLRVLSVTSDNIEDAMEGLWINVTNSVKQYDSSPVENNEEFWKQYKDSAKSVSKQDKAKIHRDSLERNWDDQIYKSFDLIQSLTSLDSTYKHRGLTDDSIRFKKIGTTRNSGIKAELDWLVGAYSIKFVVKWKNESLKTNAFWFSSHAKLRKLFAGIFPTGEFDVVMISRTDGTILFSQEQGPLELVKLPRLSSEDAVNAEQKAQTQTTQDGNYRIDARTQILDVRIAGTPYKMFLQPIRIPIDLWTSIEEETPKTGNEATQIQEKDWILAGFIKASGFRGRAMSISPTVLLGALGLLVIALLALPFLKVQFIGIRERLNKHDVLVLVITLLIAGSIIVIGLLDFFMKDQFEEKRDNHLNKLADNIQSALHAELDSIDRQLRHLTKIRFRDSLPDIVLKPIGDTLKVGNDDGKRETHLLYRKNNEQGAIDGDSILHHYPFLEMVYWIAKDGKQQKKWSVKDRTTPLIDLSERDYFTYARDRDLWRDGEHQTRWIPISNGDAKYNAVKALPGRYIESIRSKTTGKVYAVLSQRLVYKNSAGQVSIPEDTTEIVAAALSPLQSVIRPVIPPGYGFCIIKSDGTVLFHSDDSRNLRENYFDEVDNKEKVRAAVLSRTSRHIDLAYHADSYRVYSTPLPDTPWSLLVFAENRPLRITRVEILSFGLLLYGAYLLSLLIIFFSIYLLSAKFKMSGTSSTFQWLWPDEHKLDRYMLIFFGCVVIIISWLFLMFNWAPIEGMIITILFALLGQVFSHLILLVDSEEKHKFVQEIGKHHAISLGVSLLLLALGITLLQDFGELPYWLFFFWV